MYPLWLIASVLIHFTIATDLNVSKYDDDSNKANNVGNNNNMLQHKNTTYIDRAENMIRLPAITSDDNKKENKKLWKKSPKRTIQKIIKKNRQKNKKIYIIKMTSPRVKSPEDFENVQEDSHGKEDSTTSVPYQKKQGRKYNAKLTRYPMPFKNLQRKNRKRERRNVGNDLFILKDFNELKFVGDPLDKNKDYIIANAHYKDYW